MFQRKRTNPIETTYTRINTPTRHDRTKADFLHSHAVSGAAFMGLGTLYVLYFLGDEIFNHAALAQAEHGVVGWVPLAIMWTGVVNCISCLPMSKFSKGGFRSHAWMTVWMLT